MSEPAGLRGPAIALLELESIARGYRVADAVLKRAPVRIALAEAVSPGKFLLLFEGGVAEVEESLAAGREAAGALLLDTLFLTGVHDALIAALRGDFGQDLAESVGLVETQTVASALLAADTALKRAEVTLLSLQLAKGIGGKGVFSLTGSLDMVEAALEGAAAAVGAGLLVTTELIQQPHPELPATR